MGAAYGLTVGELDNSGTITMGTGALTITTQTKVGDFIFDTARSIPDYGYALAHLTDTSNPYINANGLTALTKLALDSSVNLDMGNAYNLIVGALDNSGTITMGTGTLTITTQTQVGKFIFDTARDIPDYTYNSGYFFFNNFICCFFPSHT